MSYLRTIYNKKREPKTRYPFDLIKYLIRRFNLKKGQKLLELGPGTGDFLEEFLKKGLICYGVDLEILPNINSKIKLKRVDLSRDKLPYKNNSFDIVFHKSVLEHFYRNEADLIMKETFRVLKKGGKVIILVPDWVSQIKNYFEDYTQIHPYDVLAIKDILSIYGFKNIISEKFYQLPIIWENVSLKFLCSLLAIFIDTPLARRITKITGWKFIRWSVELMILGYGEK